jgi:hypothetical protein
MSAEAHAVHTAFAATANPKIQKAGKAEFPSPQFCTWVSANGPTSTCRITNTGRNTLTVVVSGAPEKITTTDGKPFNGQWQIPPNSPTTNVTAIGDFLGTTVTIFNMSNPSTDCKVVVQG